MPRKTNSSGDSGGEDELEYLTLAEFEKFKSDFYKRPGELSFEGEDLNLWVFYSEPGEERTGQSTGGIVGKVKLRQVINYTINTIKEVEESKEEMRMKLFRLSGVLREAAAIVDKEASALNKKLPINDSPEFVEA